MSLTYREAHGAHALDAEAALPLNEVERGHVHSEEATKGRSEGGPIGEGDTCSMWRSKRSYEYGEDKGVREEEVHVFRTAVDWLREASWTPSAVRYLKEEGGWIKAARTPRVRVRVGKGTIT